MAIDYPSPFLTLKEAAALLRLSTSTLYQRADIPRHKIPGSIQYRYDRDELIAWAKSGTPAVSERLKTKSEPSESATVITKEPGKVPRRRTSRYR